MYVYQLMLHLSLTLMTISLQVSSTWTRKQDEDFIDGFMWIVQFERVVGSLCRPQQENYDSSRQ